MTIIVFLVDTSASMYQRAYLGGRPTILDVAKSAVETFVKVRQRSPESRGDRYMLLTFEEPPFNIKAGWKENLSTFMNELKNLQCLGLTTMGAALRHAFDVLNLNRMQTGIDTYGQGRCPFFLEPSVILVITDGGKLSGTSGVMDDFNLPMHAPIPGSELTREPFRWDQRLFALVLRLTGTPATERDTGLVPSDVSSIDAMCEVTGGRSYCITSHRMMMQCIDSLVQKVQSGVVINFEKIGPDPQPIDGRMDEILVQMDYDDDGTEGDSETRTSIKSNNSYLVNPSVINGNVNHGTAWHSCRKLIYVPRSAQKGFPVGFWPIPESFWPDISISVLPARSAHPNVKFTCTNQDPMVIENLPFDKYELEPSPLTQYILARKQPTTCWQVFVPNSYKNSDVGHPFGYLKASTQLTCVNLFVMPYNYPVLLPLLDELFKVHRLKPTSEWTTQFRNYMRTMPSYYAGPLRRALTRMGTQNSLAQTLIPDNLETSLSYSVLNYIKKLKNQAKIEFDRLCNDVLSKQNANAKNNSGSGSNISGGVRVSSKSVLKKDIVTHPQLSDKFVSLKEQLNEYGGFVVGLPTGKTNKNIKSYRNPFDIHRSNILDQVVRMRANVLQSSLSRMKLLDDDVTHSMPVSQMGNYQEYLKRMAQPLREIESTPVRQHMFGNPFKIDKRMMVDEADIDLMGGNNGSSSGSNGKGTKRIIGTPDLKLPHKRRPGPVPRDVVVRRPSVVAVAVTTAPPSPILVPATSVAASLSMPSSLLTVSSCTENQNFSLPFLSPVKDNILKENNSQAAKANGAITPFENFVSETNLDKPLVSDNKDDALQVNGLEEPVPIMDITDILETNPIEIPENLDNIIQPYPSQDLSIDYCIGLTLQNKLNYSVSAEDYPKIENMSEIKSKPIEDPIDVEKHNQKVKKTLFLEIRKPGKNYQTLLHNMTLLRGEVEVQESIIKQVYKESLRFKREKLAKIIKHFLVINSIDDINFK